MRLLMLTQILPYPLDAGAKTRAYYVLRHQAERGHQVTLVSFTRGDDSAASIAHLRTFCRAVHTVPMVRSRSRDLTFLTASLLTGRSFIIARDTDTGMWQLLDALLAQTEHFDAVHADQLWMAQYALRCDGLPRILDAHNAVYLIPQRLAQNERNPLKRLLLQREARALERYEAEVCRRFERVVTVTEEDRRLLQTLAGNGRAMTVIPICVDPSAKPLIGRSHHPRRLLILGTMFWPPNVAGTLWFAREVLPRVLREVPDALLTIVGKNPPPEVRALAGPNVAVTGYVADPIPYLAESAAFLVPLQAAGGMRVKILDAWCWGIPIVSTTIGAEGIAVRPGENILIADDAEAFAAAIIRLL
ncbi:MAG: glycosyltransferase family 4 protein, partial [Anaerolineae bacterium]|nr:glycosyltransferase family 4 protein [Anaerolineae bacterium]